MPLYKEKAWAQSHCAALIIRKGYISAAPVSGHQNTYCIFSGTSTRFALHSRIAMRMAMKSDQGAIPSVDGARHP